jgi:hypothetical protein
MNLCADRAGIADVKAPTATGHLDGGANNTSLAAKRGCDVRKSIATIGSTGAGSTAAAWRCQARSAPYL